MWKKVHQVCIILFLSFNVLVGLLIFARGFLLNRRVIPNKSSPCEFKSFNFLNENNSSSTDGSDKILDKISSFSTWCNANKSATYPKTVLLLVDAMRYDFVERMPYLRTLLEQSNNFKSNKKKKSGWKEDMYSCKFKFRADPPTTTMQRLKAIATGTMSTFLDASANFNSYEVEEDSLIHQMNATGKRIAFLGDDTWLNLFPPIYFTSPFVEGHPSFNAWDLDTVDRAVNESIHKVLTKENKAHWDVLIAHLLGVDHCGHRYGPNHPEMKRKLEETDNVIKFIVESVDDDTLIVIFGDHGMTSTGDHGGDSEIETDAGLVLLAKNKKKLLCPSMTEGHDVTVSQIDIVPTLSAIIGIPIPYSSIGSLIRGVLPKSVESQAIVANVAQINNYLSRYAGKVDVDEEDIREFAGSDKVSQLFFEVEKAFRKSQKNGFGDLSRFDDTSKIYFAEVRSFAEATWTQFNVPLMYGGAFVSFLSVVCIITYVATISAFEACTVGKRKGKDSSLPWMWLGAAETVVIAICFVRLNNSIKIFVICITTISGMSVFLVKLLKRLRKKIVVSKPGFGGMCSKVTRNGSKKDGGVPKYFRINWRIPIGNFVGWETLPMVLYLFTCLAVFSNSFIINEGYVLGYGVIAVVFFHLLCSRRPLTTLGLPSSGTVKDTCFVFNLPVVQKYYRCSWISFLCFAAVIRGGYSFFRCREELTTCEEGFLLHKQLASLPSDWLVQKYIRYGIELVALAVFVVVFRHWLMLRQVSASSRASAVVAKFVPTVLVVLLSAFRAIQGLPLVSLDSRHMRPFLDYIPRVFNVVAMGSLGLLWLKPLCCVGRCRPHKKVLSALLCSRTYRIGNTLKQDDTNGEINHKFNDVMENGTSVNAYELRSEYWTSSQNNDNLSEDVFTSVLLTAGTLLTVFLVQTTSEGMSPSVMMIMCAVVCLVGVFRSSSSNNLDSWTAVISWTMASQYFFYATGHQPVFSAIPWDSAFATSNSSSLGTSPDSLWSWIPPALFVLGNLHASHIIFTVLLPLLVYWKADKDKPETLMGDMERRNTLMLYAKFIALHGLKLLFCMLCAAWQRRHLMVWKIFAPKLIFEAVSFIMLSGVVAVGILFFMRIDYAFRKHVSEENQRLKIP